MDIKTENNYIRLYNLEKVSELTGLSRKTLYKHIRAGNLKAEKTGGKWWTTKTAIEKFYSLLKGA